MSWKPHWQELLVCLIRLEQGENLDENQRNLLQITERFFQAIIGSSSEFPPQLRSVCHCLYQVDPRRPLSWLLPPAARLGSPPLPACVQCHLHILSSCLSKVSWCCSTYCSLHHTHQCTVVHSFQLYAYCWFKTFVFDHFHVQKVPIPFLNYIFSVYLAKFCLYQGRKPLKHHVTLNFYIILEEDLVYPAFAIVTVHCLPICLKCCFPVESKPIQYKHWQ